jgi:hypothetical protein
MEHPIVDKVLRNLARAKDHLQRNAKKYVDPRAAAGPVFRIKSEK